MTLRLAHGRLECHVDPFDFDTALTKLAALDARKSRIADPRFFAGTLAGTLEPTPMCTL
jgi:hypothetical protein